MQTTRYSAQDEQELMARLWSPAIKDNPLAFVMFAYPWGVKEDQLLQLITHQSVQHVLLQ